uniref:Taste receptor type 2 n=1 Tax=Pyxicephalus adspersus TaxID=30357 RepID=A0AAV3A3D1_PYXAD|nr:TPA: hypothetical protein GDO54_009881 [Pyxicephalus adspersus]
MVNSTEETSYEDYLSLIALGATLVFAGLPIQSFIVAVNVIDWLKRRSITGADQIITSIGISRIFSHTAVLLALFSSLYVTKIPEVVFALCYLTEYSSAIASIWLSTLLSIFFYVKISTFHNVFFLRLKTIISQRVTYLIIGSLLLFLGYTFIYNFALLINRFRNSTQDYISYYKQLEIISYVNILWFVSPLLIFFIVSLLLIILLGFHMRRMNNHGNMTSSTDTYLRIMRFTFLSFLVSAYYITLNVFQRYILSFTFVWVFITMNIFPVLHSVLLIYVAVKLRNHFFRIVYCITDRFLKRKAPRPREPVVVISLQIKKG